MSVWGLKTLACTAGVLTLASAASAALIDDFDVPLAAPTVLTATQGTSVTSTVTTLASPSYAFDNRLVTLTTDPGPDFAISVFTIATSLAVEFASPTGSGDLSLAYTNADASGVDFAANSITKIVFESYDLPAGVPLDITVALTDGSAGSGSIAASLAVSVTSSTVFNLDFSGVGVDLSDVTSLTLTFDFPAAADFTIDSIALVPEPSTALLVGIGAIAALRGRKKLCHLR